MGRYAEGAIKRRLDTLDRRQRTGTVVAEQIRG
jgi:hypothetical protein